MDTRLRRATEGENARYGTGERDMRLIDADELIRKGTSTFDESIPIADFIEIVELRPTIEAEPIRHGHWELIDGEEPRRYGCSQCKRMVWHEENYCPNCGARMDEDDTAPSEEAYDDFYAKHRD